MRSSSAVRGNITVQGNETRVVIGAFRILSLVAKQIGAFRVLLLVAKCYIGKSNHHCQASQYHQIIGHHQCPKTMLIRPCRYIHTALLIYPHNPVIHTDQLDYLITVLRTGCFCICPGIDSRSILLADNLYQDQCRNSQLVTLQY